MRGALDDIGDTSEQILGKLGRMGIGGITGLTDMARPVSDPVYTGLGYLARGTGFPSAANYLFSAANAPTNAEIAQRYYDLKTSGKYKPRNNYESIIDAIGQMGVGAMTPMGLAKGYSALDKTGIWADETGSLGGIKAKTADKQKLALAQKMDESGELPAKIWKETGWFKGHDNQWRFEIPDENAKFIGQYGIGKMGQFLEHPELYEAYPDLKDIRMTYSEPSEFVMGNYYHPATDSINISANNPYEALSIALHEGGGHAVQAREGFKTGTRVLPVDGTIKEAAQQYGPALRASKKNLHLDDSINLRKYLREKGHPTTSVTYNPTIKTRRYVEDMNQFAINNNLTNLQNDTRSWLDAYDAAAKREHDAFLKYIQNEAEIEARTIEHRKNYRAMHRIKVPFMDDFNYYKELADEGKQYE